LHKGNLSQTLPLITLVPLGMQSQGNSS